MRIGHYMRYMFEPGGIAAYIRRISDAQKRMGHEVFFFDREPACSGRTAAGVQCTRCDHDLMKRARELRLDILHLHTMVDAGAVNQMPVLRTVHTHAPYCPSQGRFLKAPGVACNRPYSFWGCLKGHLLDRCGSMTPLSIKRNFQHTWQEMKGLPGVDVITVSQFLKDQMVREGYPERRIEVLYLPAPEVSDPSPLEADAAPRFVFLGRMIPHKGVDWLLRAMTRVSSRATLELAGTGNQEAEYRELARVLGLEDRVRFHGWLEGDAASILLRGARALVFPSIWHEPGGTVAFEAMVHQRPVIMSRVGGMPEVVEHEQNGLLVAAGDEAGLAAAIDRLAIDTPLARRLGEHGRHRATVQYTLASHMDRLMSKYQAVVERWDAAPTTVASPARPAY